jgi:predicted HNH restriction endonuclease
MMARWNDLPWREDVYEAAKLWKTRCLLEDGSVFNEKAIWTQSQLSELQGLIVGNADFGDDTFQTKLYRQIKTAPPDVIQLAAEVLWFIYLFPLGQRVGDAKPSTTIKTKIREIHSILDWGSLPKPSSVVMTANALSGIGRTGLFYKKYFHAIRYFLEVIIAFKELSANEKSTLLAPGSAWRFAKFNDSFEQETSVPLRHALLFFLFPDEFERMVSQGHKDGIVRHFSDLLSRSTRDHLTSARGSNRLVATDMAINEIRRELERAYPDESMDFYLEPIQIQSMKNGKKISVWLPVENVKARLARNVQPNVQPVAPNEDSTLSETATEGELRLYQYFGKNRKSLREPKLNAFRAQHGELSCECCDERGDRFDATIRDAIFEVHHRKPVADYKDEGKSTNLDDLAVLCSNCHNAIHATPRMLSVQDFREQFRRLKT